MKHKRQNRTENEGDEDAAQRKSDRVEESDSEFNQDGKVRR